MQTILRPIAGRARGCSVRWWAVEQLRLADELGSFAVTHPPIEARPMIVALTAEGCGSWVIARRLNAAGVSTPTGRGQWHPATVRRYTNPGPWAAYMRQYRHRPG